MRSLRKIRGKEGRGRTGEAKGEKGVIS